MEKFLCLCCNIEKEGTYYEWYEIFKHPNRGINLKEDIIYLCANCGAKICKTCTNNNIKTNSWSGWEKSTCPICKESFAPAVQSELERGKQVNKQKIQTELNEQKEKKKNLSNQQAHTDEENNKKIHHNYIVYPKSLGVLRFAAWIGLFASIILAIIFWNNGGAYNFGLGLGIIFQGIFVCALFHVIAVIGENLVSINHNTKILVEKEE